MFIIDPIASLLVVAGVFIYFACKGSGKTAVKMTKEEYIKAVISNNERSRKEQQERLAEHRRREKETFNRKFGRTG